MSPIRTSTISQFLTDNSTMLQSKNGESQMVKRRSEKKEENGKTNVRKRIVKVIDVKPEENSSSDEEIDSEDYKRDKSNNRDWHSSSMSNGRKMIKSKQEENVKKRIVKVIDVKPEESSCSDEEIDSEDYKTSKSSFRNWYKNGKSNSPKMIKREQSAGLSEYEKMIEKNRAERIAFMKSLKLDEAKSDFADVVDKVKKKKVQPVKRVYKSVENTSPPVIRKSRRLANMKADLDLSEDALFSKAINEAKEAEKRVELPPELPFKNSMKFEQLYESYVLDINIQESKGKSKKISYDKSVIQKLNLDEFNIAKVTPARITALAWYPSAENLIVAAGSKYGNLGIWNVETDSSPYLLRNHLEGTTNLQFNPLNRVKLLSSSYDGTLRCGDMVKHIFSEVYNVSDETCCTWFDFLSDKTYLVAQKNGQVALVDDRTEKKRCEKKHTCHDYSVKTVNVHPVNKNFFVTAENKGAIRLWDLRKLQKQPVADIIHHKRCVQSAFFSPVTGNSILTTSSDDTISLFDSTNLTQDIRLKQIMKHNNFTGRWLSVFRATWLPNSDDAFVIGSMQEPRRIQVYDKNMDVVHIIMNDNLTTISSTNAFHPLRPALAGGNSSGKVVVFT